MSALAVGLTDALWLCPERALRLFLASVSFVDPVRTVAPLAPHLCWRCPSFASGSSCGGASPHTLGSIGARGVRGGSTYIAFHRTWSVSTFDRTPIGAQVGVSYFSCATFRKYSWRFYLSVSLTFACPVLNFPIGLCSLDTCRDE